MAYRVLMGRKYPFLLLEGRAGERCAHEAPRRGIRKDGTWYTYGWDLTKNICESARRPPKGRLREQAVRAIGQTRSVCPAGARSREAAPSQVFSSGGTILTAYTYSPYGAVTATGNATQHIQWSSEYNDSELGLVYYNYRHYNPADGRWIRKDPLRGVIWERAYSYTDNNPYKRGDLLGLESFVPDTTPLSEEALAWVKSNCAWFKEVGDAFRFKEPELIAVATAMAEEYSQKNNPLHRAVDAVQDGVIKLTDLIIETSLQKFKIFGYELKPDVGPGNINVNTALKARHYTFNRRRLDLTREMRKILGEKEIARVLVDDRGSIVYGAAEMRRQIDQFNTFLKNKNVSIEQMTDHDLSQNLVDLWRQGDGRFSKMEATYNEEKGCYMPEHKHHGISLAEEKYNQIKDALKNCED